MSFQAVLPTPRISWFARRHFSRYASCWMLSTIAIVIGIKLLTRTADNNFTETLRVITLIPSTHVLGALWIFFGLSRMCALIAVGGSQLRWWTSYTRTIFSGLMTVFWLQLAVGALWAHPAATTAMMFPVFMLFDLLNTSDAAYDIQLPWKK